MKKTFFAFGCLLALFFVLPLISTAEPSGKSNTEIGEVGALAGKVFLIRDGERFTLTEGAKLHAGDRIETDPSGAVRIIQKDGNILYVGTSSSLILMTPVRISLINGSVRVKSTGEMAVFTPTGESVTGMAVGAEFAVRQDGTLTEVAALREAVFFQGRTIHSGNVGESGSAGYLKLRPLSEDEAETYLAIGSFGAHDIAPLGYTKPEKDKASSNDKPNAPSSFKSVLP